MSLLEVISKASSANSLLSNEEFDYPIVLNPLHILTTLKPETNDPEPGQPLEKLVGWEISQSDLELTTMGEKFCKQLRRKLKNTSSFGKNEFLAMFSSYLVKVGEKLGMSEKLNKLEEDFVCDMIKKLGISTSRDVKSLVLEACLVLEVWGVLESLITINLVEPSCTSNLVHKLIEKRRSDLIVLCLQHLGDLQTYELMCILKYFLVLPSDGYKSLVAVREDWESQVLLAIEKASGKGVSGKNKSLAKDASLLVMLAHDGFSITELCLHYLVASQNFDEVIFSACIGKLNGEEIKGLIQYLGKWLKKYERFPQAGPCPKASAALGLKVCDWIPTLENVVKCFGLVVDEHFSSMVLHSDIREDLMSFEGVVCSLAAEARLCAALAPMIDSLGSNREDML